MNRLFTLIVWLLAFGLQTAGGSPVWEVTGEGSKLYVGGTFHLLRKSDFPLPSAFDAAYAESATLVFETDLAKMNDPSVQQLMLQQGMLAEGTLETLLTEETYRLLADYCADVGVRLDMFNQFKPSIVLLSVALIELERLGLSEEGVDMHYFRKGKNDGKTIGELEAVEEQIAFICSMGEGNEEAFVHHSIRDMESSLDELPNLISLWRSGDREGMKQSFIDPLKKEYPDLYETLIVNRNRNWMPEIEALLQTAETEFVLVGAGHLVGQDGILTVLEGRGYTVEKLER